MTRPASPLRPATTAACSRWPIRAIACWLHPAAPAALLLALIIVYPVGRLVYTSFHDLSLTSGLPAASRARELP